MLYVHYKANFLRLILTLPIGLKENLIPSSINRPLSLVKSDFINSYSEFAY